MIWLYLRLLFHYLLFELLLYQCSSVFTAVVWPLSCCFRGLNLFVTPTRDAMALGGAFRARWLVSCWVDGWLFQAWCCERRARGLVACSDSNEGSAPASANWVSVTLCTKLSAFRYLHLVFQWMQTYFIYDFRNERKYFPWLSDEIKRTFELRSEKRSVSYSVKAV